MAVEVGTFSVSSAGNISVTGSSFLATNIEFRMGARFGTTETRVQRTDGWTDGTVETCHSLFHDSTGERCKAFNDRCMHHYERVSGTITDKVVFTFVSFDNNGGGDYGFTINATAGDSAYQVYFRMSDV